MYSGQYSVKVHIHDFHTVAAGLAEHGGKLYVISHDLAVAHVFKRGIARRCRETERPVLCGQVIGIQHSLRLFVPAEPFVGKGIQRIFGQPAEEIVEPVAQSFSRFASGKDGGKEIGVQVFRQISDPVVFTHQYLSHRLVDNKGINLVSGQGRHQVSLRVIIFHAGARQLFLYRRVKAGAGLYADTRFFQLEKRNKCARVLLFSINLPGKKGRKSKQETDARHYHTFQDRFQSHTLSPWLRVCRFFRVFTIRIIPDAASASKTRIIPMIRHNWGTL